MKAVESAYNVARERMQSHHDVDEALGIVNCILDGYGVEYVSMAQRELAYVNLGDTYDSTVCAEGERLFIGSWGDWAEEAEQDYCKAEGVIRCGYCGEFSGHEPGTEYRDIICEHCGNKVA